MVLEAKGESLFVQKYGGSSLADATRIRHVASHIKACVQAGHALIIVVSAMGSETDRLEALAKELSPEGACSHSSRRFAQREWDMLLSAGERVSAALLAIRLHALGVHATSLTGSQVGILTTADHGDARIQQILGARVRDQLACNRVVIVAGFQGVCPETRDVTTLGRGGSDLTAVALAKVLHADRCQIFTDVDGVYRCHPDLIPTVNEGGQDDEGSQDSEDGRLQPSMRLARVSWEQMHTMSQFGAKVLHARAAQMARDYQVQLEVRSSFDFDRPGTLVADDPAEKADLITIEKSATQKTTMQRVSVRKQKDSQAMTDNAITKNAITKTTELTEHLETKAAVSGSQQEPHLPSEQLEQEGVFAMVAMPEVVRLTMSGLEEVACRQDWLACMQHGGLVWVASRLEAKRFEGVLEKRLLEPWLKALPVSLTDRLQVESDLSLITLVGAGFARRPEMLLDLDGMLARPKTWLFEDTRIQLLVAQDQLEAAQRELMTRWLTQS